MKAIKERAKVYGSKGKTNLNKYHREKSYIEIATEQTVIDKKLIMKAYCQRCQDMGGGYPCSHKCQEYCNFEKTLEG